MNVEGENGKQRKVLGRGLAALIQPTNNSPAQTHRHSGLETLPIERLFPNQSQPRKHFEKDALEELANSIKAQGILQPILVRKLEAGYEIIAGERRWRAAGLAGLKSIPVIIKDYNDRDALAVALIENIQREDLDAIEEAQAYSGLLSEHGFTQEALATALGKNRATIANSLRLLKLPQPVLDLLGCGDLTAGHARALMTVKDETKVERLARDVVDRKMSVRDTESKARALNKATKPQASAEPESLSGRAVEEKLMQALGTKVRLVQRRGKGRVEIVFHSLDQLDDLIDRLLK